MGSLPTWARPRRANHPFQFLVDDQQQDVEISEEMFIITKETAEAYRRELQLVGGVAPVAVLPRPTDTSNLIDSGTDQRRTPGGLNVHYTSQKSAMKCSGAIPDQKWMNFYTQFLTVLGVNSGLTLTVKVECRPEGGSRSRSRKKNSALSEIGLDDRID